MIKRRGASQLTEDVSWARPASTPSNDGPALSKRQRVEPWACPEPARRTSPALRQRVKRRACPEPAASNDGPALSKRQRVERGGGVTFDVTRRFFQMPSS